MVVSGTALFTCRGMFCRHVVIFVIKVCCVAMIVMPSFIGTGIVANVRVNLTEVGNVGEVSVEAVMILLFEGSGKVEAC